MCVPEYDFQIERTTISKCTVHFEAESEEQALSQCEQFLWDLNSTQCSECGSSPANIKVPETELDSDVWELE